MKYGFVRTDKGHLRPFENYRKIERGRNKSRNEVKLPHGRPRQILVPEASIHRFPEASGK